MVRFFTLFFIWGLFSIISKVYSQQNLFNIPSGDITPKKKWFFQHQTNFYQPWELEMKNHFVYGLGAGFDIGVNIINIPFDFRSKQIMPFNSNPYSTTTPLSPLLLFTAQKQFHVTKTLDFNFGTQAGINLARYDLVKPVFFNYALFSAHLFDRLKLVFGGYHTLRYKAGDGSLGGIMLGFELQIHDKFIIMGDFLSGTNGLGNTVIGGTWNVSKRVQLCLGALLPNLGTQNKPGVVFELNLLGWDLEH